MKYSKSALAIFLSILILFSTSLFLYSCGVSNPTGSGGGQTGLSALTAPVIQKAYVSGMKISVINTQTNTMINQIDLWGGFAAGMAINPKTNKLYATDINTNRLFVIDTNINFIVSISSVGLKPYGVTVNTLTNKIYVANSGNNTVSAINGSNNSIIATIPVGTQPERIAVDETTNTIYVSNSMGNSVSIIDGNTNQVTNTIAVAGKPMDVAVDPSIAQAYVSTAGNITVIDTASQTLKTNISIPAGTPPLNRIAVNQITHQVYVSATNSLVVVDGSVNKVIGTTSNTAHVSYMALDDVSNKLYLNQWNYFGDSWAKTMSGDHKVNVADLSNMVITATSPSIPSALNILSTVIFSWTVPMQFNMIIVDGDIVVVNTAPRTTTPPPPSNTPPPPASGATLASLTIEPATLTVGIGQTASFSAIAHYSDGSTQDVTADAVTTWEPVTFIISMNLDAPPSTGGTAIAANPTTTPLGLLGLSGLTNGNTTTTLAPNLRQALNLVTYTSPDTGQGNGQVSYKGLTRTFSMIVKNLGLKEIVVTPPTATIYIHENANSALRTQQYKAMGKYYTAPDKDITTSASWNSSNNTVATIDTSGLATAGVMPGSVSVTANIGLVISNKAELCVECRKYTRYSQIDPTWSANMYDHLGKTIGAVGCAMTNMAMIIDSSHVLYSGTTPPVLNEWMKQHNGFTNSYQFVQQPNGTYKYVTDIGGVHWDVPFRYTQNGIILHSAYQNEDYNPVTKTLTPLSSLFNPPTMLDRYLNTCNVIIAEVKQPSGNFHWVLITKKQGNDYFYIDPLSYPANEFLLKNKYNSEIYAYHVYQIL